MKSTILLCLIFASLTSISQSAKDSIIIKSINVENNVQSQNVTGSLVTINSTFFYDTTLYHTSKPQKIVYELLLFDKNKQPIKTVESTKFKSSNGQFKISIPRFDYKENLSVFIPYYALDIPQGNNVLALTLSVYAMDTSITQSRRKIKCEGKIAKAFTINKPATKTFKIRVNGVKISDTDKKGKAWDWTGGLADIFYSIEFNNKYNNDILFSSTTVKNATSAAWLDYSNTITMTEGDKISISLYDEDTMFDDNIGTKNFSYDELLKAAMEKTEMSFEKVNYCVIDVVK